MDDETVARFRRAYWRAFLDLDTIRLRNWERSRVTLPQLRVLYYLRRHPGATTGELSRALGISVSTTSGLVIKLVDRGLVARTSAEADRRQEPLYLADDGAALLGELAGSGRVFLEQVAELVGGQLEAVTVALERVADAAAEARAQREQVAEQAETVEPAAAQRRPDGVGGGL